MTPDLVAHHAAERPDALAFINEGRAITYRQFHRDLSSMTAALRAFALPPGAAAAIGCEDFYHHWLIALGFERLGVATSSLVGSETPGCRPLLAAMDLVLSEQPFGADMARRHHPVTPAWIEAALAVAGGARPETSAGRPDAPIRVIRTSGTTGVSKRITLLRSMFDLWVEVWIWFHEPAPGARFLLTLPFSVGGSYACATAFLRSGGTIVVDRRRAIADSLSVYAIEHVILLPAQLTQMLEGLPRDHAKPANLTISSFGAPVSPALRARATQLLAREIKDLYGTNEVGFIAMAGAADGDGRLSILPRIEVEIVDDRDTPLPHGQPGRVRVRTEQMASAYLDDPEASSAMFKDGWFYPGDIGMLHGGRRLELVGRGDELLNIGGLKFAPGTVEEMLVRSGLARDAAVSTIPNSDGVDELCVAAPREAIAPFAQGEIERLLGATIRVVTIPRIPRTETGKIQRTLLREAIAQAIASGAAKT
jgi:acyl-coenzyme A synthetase/AMP-(fatty) acid ligase